MASRLQALEWWRREGEAERENGRENQEALMSEGLEAS